ncbi:copper resistance protein B [Novosphingobium mangrovi (ex Huang et al. 2023)]|uniref:Copper resistance protein B n=1 Tax=Novosphingobium mangrovi (ex Huang et al. 2023) TaxID=2976432 RepID=A0ABT2I388_9SPHN|nr:copper resistance protein B [Novosphingobium mangrovi (ex Huang et al. 2023)]MCT2399270.1 copper resistance protein B [Novosphingobium mangrovi (ex Huang et al. 2023)]
MKILLALPALVLAQPAWAQHTGHDMPMAEPASAPGAQAEDQPHHHETATPASDPHAGHAMPHTMTMPMPAAGTSAPSSETAPPPEAGSGPARAADAIWGADAMKASRAALARGMGAMMLSKAMVDRLEYRAHKGTDGYLWDAQGWYGGDVDKLWIKSEGEGAFGGKPEQAEGQALWSHAIGPWFDLQAGVRHDFAGPDRTHAVIGIQGLAPYRFEIDAAAFVSNKGDVTARIEAELDQRVTQRLILQPRAEVTLSAQDIPELGVGSGLDKAELGLRLRYEIAREFAPYIGVEHEWRAGGSADYARAAGDSTSRTSLVAGIRMWF